MSIMLPLLVFKMALITFYLWTGSTLMHSKNCQKIMQR